MIYLEITGTKKEETEASLLQIVNTLLEQQNTRIFLIDEMQTIISRLNLKSFRLITVSTKTRLQEVLFEDYAEQVVCVVPTYELNVKKHLKKILSRCKEYALPSDNPIYCIYFE